MEDKRLVAPHSLKRLAFVEKELGPEGSGDQLGAERMADLLSTHAAEQGDE